MAKEEFIKVSLTKALFGLVAGAVYPAVKVQGGYQVTSGTGYPVVVPNSIIQEVEGAPAASGRQAVRQKPTSAEIAALSNARLQAPEEPLAVQMQSVGIVGAILAGEQNAPVKPPLTDEEKAEKVELLKKQQATAELLKKRKCLEPHAQPALQEGQCWLSDLTGGALPNSKVDHIITVNPPGTFPKEMMEDVPNFDIFHRWDPNVLEAIHVAYVNNEKALLSGPAGSGKSTSPAQYCALVQHPFMRLNGKTSVDASAFIGFLWAGPNGTEFAEGLIPVGMRNGYYVLMDEVFKLPAEIQMSFQTVYEENGFLLLDEKPGLLSDKLVKPHEMFRLMATDNVKGVGDNFEKYGATQVQDVSTLDRFTLTCEVPYLSEEAEVEVLQQMFPDMPSDSIDRFVKLANLVRDGYMNNVVSITLSLRGLKMMCTRYLKNNLSESVCFNMTYRNKLAEDSEIETVNSYVEAVDLSTSVPVLSKAQTPQSALDEESAEKERSLPWKKGDTTF
jgi:cobaltochelatase CobS